MRIKNQLFQLSRKLQKGYIITILACVLAVLCYAILQLFIPYTSFTNGLLLTVIISILVSYPVTHLVFLYAQTIKKKNEEVKMHNEIKNRLIYILSHDIKSPLSNIQQTLQMIRDSSLQGDEFLALSDNFSRDIANTLNLTRNIIRWIQVQQDDFKPDIHFLKLNEAITETIELYRPIAEKKDINLLSTGSGEMGIHTDREMFKVVLRNLISNAIKFTHPGGNIIVNYSCEINACFVSVSDNGIGIDQEKIDDLFNIHQMSSEKGTLNERGTGIGLHLSKNILDHLQGKIWVESEPGSGTTFHFTLPDIQAPSQS
ncbi:Hypothetical protein C900_03311 [Fulvivirga imtechensis AK7]|uniref:histidine kinase n=1 Tax=Fulvivirga imtechensis AK7 TaxID=1237149 RepID=L8JPJ0_9BACT|nr:HAMP domain-containing sensor histidine kinase [Fulvivirga imtechensis]ELR70876.1 Hypothetical protein C900_03311 [Fulvivirga imtechensis AK7]